MTVGSVMEVEEPPELSGHGLAVSYGGAVALQDVNIDLRKAEALAVLGRNGAGKTTLLRTLVGLVRPDRGRVTRRGVELRSVAQSVASRVRFVPESGNVFTDLSVLENLHTGALRVPRSAREARVEAVLALLPVLEPLRKRQGGQLSGGERQALAVGRAVMAQPEVLVLDEPTLGLAPRLAEGLMDVLSGLQQETGIAIIIAEQSAVLTRRLCRRSVTLDVGRVVGMD